MMSLAPSAARPWRRAVVLLLVAAMIQSAFVAISEPARRGAL